ncbi:fimbria/pilus periplasmic chaperone [Acinetobacter sp. ANC 4558]|uniref:fimbria/pilus periplasmic chaperone n=1 Tax=Acinetobacter sp. ANC 4558 TaxID=1977876 RepID=UPI001BB468B5|nr:fimbria/pilus periplasmic chaperone [Acinetobacter sp. ANC 4558]
MNRLMLNKKILTQVFMVSFVGLSTLSHSAITIDRTRAIFNGSQKSMTLIVSNKNNKLPYLAQAWVENSDSQKVSFPFIVLPPLQRIEPGQSNQIRIEASTKINELPQDRESLYYFNVREVPPKSDKPNVMQIALQSKIKLFYRPASLELNSTEMMNNPWQDKLQLIKQNGGVTAKNPTPYYITILSIRQSKTSADAENFEATMISPFSQEALPIKAQWLGSSPAVTYINDYGGRIQMQFQCEINNCNVIKTPAKE